MAPWHLVPMIKKKSGWESTFQSMPPKKNESNDYIIPPRIMEIEKWKNLGRVVNVVMSNLFFEGVATGSGG